MQDLLGFVTCCGAVWFAGFCQSRSLVFVILAWGLGLRCGGRKPDRLLVKEGDMVKTPQAIAILDSRDRQQAALDQAQEQVRVAEANLAKVKAGAKNGEIQAQKATIARSRVPIAATKSQRNRRSLPEEKSIAAPSLQRNKPQLRA